MKVKKTKLIQQAKGRKRGIYEITLRVTDYDMDMLEDFATTYAPFKWSHKPKWYLSDMDKLMETCEYEERYAKWIINLWHNFYTLWRKYDRD